MKKLALFTAVAVLAWAADARAETVKLLISGAHWPGCGGKIAEALGQVPTAKVQGKIAKGAGEAATVPVTVDLDTTKADVGDLAKAAAAADTPHRSKSAPSVTLVIPASGVNDTNAGKVGDALKDVKGVDAKASKADPKAKEVHVKLDDKGGAKLADIKQALATYTK